MKGAYTVELVEQLLASDLGELRLRLTRHHLLLGTREDGQEVRISPYGWPPCYLPGHRAAASRRWRGGSASAWSRRVISAAITRRYTLPATSPLTGAAGGGPTS